MTISAALLTKLKRRYGEQNVIRWSHPNETDFVTEDVDVISAAMDDVEAEVIEGLAGVYFDETNGHHTALMVDGIAYYMRARAADRALKESELSSLDVRAQKLRQVTNSNRMRPTTALAVPLSGRNKTAKYSDDKKLCRLGINGKNAPTGTTTREAF